MDSPFDWIPNEMLDKILHSTPLKHPKELLNCRKVTPLWTEILKPYKVYMFFNNVLPLLSKYLGWEAHLNLRLVCHGWQMVMEDYLDGRMGAQFPEYLMPARCSRSSLRGRERVESFLNQMVHLPRGHNPIPDRKLFLNPYLPINHPMQLAGLGMGNHGPVYWPLVMDLLDLIGHHVWFCKFYVTGGDHEQARLTRECLSKMPNLKELELYGPLFGGWIETEQGRLELLNNPLPELAQLARLSLSRLPRLLVEAMVQKYGHQLESFEYVLNEHHSTSPFGPVLNRLDSFTVSSHARIPFVKTHLLSLQPNSVTKLNLSCEFRELEFPSMFQVLLHFEQSLKELELGQFFIQRPKNWSRFGHLQLPKLEKFTVDGYLKSYDFLSGISRALQVFVIKLPYMDNNWRVLHLHVTKLNSLGVQGFGVDCVCDSLLWSKIPTLRFLRIVNHRNHLLRSCSRDTFDYIEKNRDSERVAEIVPCRLIEPEQEPPFVFLLDD